MGAIWGFVLGLFSGGVIGVFLMALVMVGKERTEQDQDHRKHA